MKNGLGISLQLIGGMSCNINITAERLLRTIYGVEGAHIMQHSQAALHCLYITAHTPSKYGTGAADHE